MALAVPLGDFEALHRLIKTIHLRKHVSAIQADGSDREIVVGVFEGFLSAIVMGERIVVAIQAVVQIAQGDFQVGKVWSIVRFLERGARTLGEAMGLGIPAEIHQVVYLGNQSTPNFAAQTRLLEEFDGAAEERLRVGGFPHGVENLTLGPAGIGPSQWSVDQRGDIEVGFGQDLRQIRITRKEFSDSAGDGFDESLAGRAFSVRDEGPLLGSIPDLGQRGQILLGIRNGHDSSASYVGSLPARIRK